MKVTVRGMVVPPNKFLAKTVSRHKMLALITHNHQVTALLNYCLSTIMCHNHQKKSGVSDYHVINIHNNSQVFLGEYLYVCLGEMK